MDDHLQEVLSDICAFQVADLDRASAIKVMEEELRSHPEDYKDVIIKDGKIFLLSQ